MCGVFGFISKDGKTSFKLETLERIATVTERRGKHAFGLAWIDSHGRLKCYKQQGRITDHLGLLAMARDAVMLIGHTRYATQGDPAQNINNHPHHADGGWIVHNGQVKNYEALLEEHKMLVSSVCDSETIARLYEDNQGSRQVRLNAAVCAVAEGPLAVLGLWNHQPELVAVRRGNPLHWSETKRGVYLASLAEGHPTPAKSVRDDHSLSFRFKKDKCHAHLCPLEVHPDRSVPHDD